MRKVARIILWILALLILLQLAGMVVIQSPAVQTWLGKKIIGRLQDKMDADVSFASASIRPFDALVLEDVLVMDRAPQVAFMDTLLHVKHLSARFSVMGLLNGGSIELRRATLDGGCFHLVMEPNPANPDLPMTNLQRMFRLEDDEEDPVYEWGNLLHGNNVEIKDVHFRMENLEGDARYKEAGVIIPEGTIDWNHLNLIVEHLKVNRLSVADDLITATVRGLNVRELETGLRITDLSAEKVRVGKGSVHVEGIKGALSPDTVLDVLSLDMDGKMDWYGDFLDRICLDVRLGANTFVDMKTISHFGPGLDKMGFSGHIRGRMKGLVSDFTLSGMVAETQQGRLKIRASGRMWGLPDIEATQLDMTLRELSFGLPELARFIEDWAPEVQLDGVRKLGGGERFTLSGNVNGPMNGLDVNALLATGTGKAQADIRLEHMLDHAQSMRIGGALSTENLPLGRILGEKALGALTLNTALQAALNPEGISVQLDTLHVSRLQALGYDYSGLTASGNYSPTDFDIRLRADDPALRLQARGEYHENAVRDGTLDATVQVDRANLGRMNVDKRGVSILEGLHAGLHLVREKAHTKGSARVDNFRLKNSSGPHPIPALTLTVDAVDTLHRLQLNSEMLTASFEGDHPVTDFVDHLKDLVLGQELWALLDGKQRSYSGGAYTLNLQALQTHELLSFLTPGLYVENGTQAALSVSRDGRLDAALQSGRLAMEGKYLKDIRLNLDNAGSAVKASLSAGTISLGSIQLDNNRLDLCADDNRLDLGYAFDNEADAPTRAELYVTSTLEHVNKGLVLTAQTLPSKLCYNGQEWDISSGPVHYAGGHLDVDHFLIGHDNQRLCADGAYGKGHADTLRVNLDQFDISLVNSINADLLPPLGGLMTGQALLLSSKEGAGGLLAEIVCDSTRIDGREVGTLALSSVWDEPQQRYNGTLTTRLNGRTPLNAEGYLVPESKQLQLGARLDAFDLGYAQPFLKTIFNQFEGALSGEVGIQGKLGQLQPYSRDLRLSDGLLCLDFTRAAYSLNGPLSLDGKGLHFDHLKISDGEKGEGRVYGGILMNLSRLQDMRMDTHVQLKDMKALSLQRGDNPLLWGEVYASGQVDVTGPLSRLTLAVDATSTQPGVFHLPLGSSKSSSSAELLTFTQDPDTVNADPYELMMRAREEMQEKAGDMHFAARIKASPELQVFIDVDEQSSLNARGSGIIQLDSQAAQGFQMSGDYVLTDGSFHFSAINLVNRDFSILDGSSVRFNGEVMDTDLDVKGRYITKASLSNLLPSYDDSGNNAGSRRTVYCDINISGKLRNPVVDFGIEVPDLNPITQGELESALNSEDKVQKQFVYLLIAGNFLPTEESGVTTNGSDVLYSNVSSIMSGQINNIFQKLDIPLDLGLNYQSTQAGMDMFDVAVSTQLFHNRVVVNGAVGRKKMEGGTTTNELAGDVDIEVKLNRSGSLRLTVFSHSADQFTYYLDNSQRNGAGITYQREFNSLAQFFREVFSTKEQREILALEAAQQPSVTLLVQEDGKTKPKVHEQ